MNLLTSSGFSGGGGAQSPPCGDTWPPTGLSFAPPPTSPSWSSQQWSRVPCPTLFSCSDAKKDWSGTFLHLSGLFLQVQALGQLCPQWTYQQWHSWGRCLLGRIPNPGDPVLSVHSSKHWPKPLLSGPSLLNFLSQSDWQLSVCDHSLICMFPIYAFYCRF